MPFHRNLIKSKQNKQLFPLFYQFLLSFCWCEAAALTSHSLLGLVLLPFPFISIFSHPVQFASAALTSLNVALFLEDPWDVFFLFPKPSNSIIYFSFELFICKSFFVTIYIFDVESKQKSGTFSNDLALQFLKLCSISPDYPCFVSAAFAI